MYFGKNTFDMDNKKVSGPYFAYISIVLNSFAVSSDHPPYMQSINNKFINN